MALRNTPAIHPISHVTTVVTTTAGETREVSTSEVLKYSVPEVCAVLGISMDPATHTLTFSMDRENTLLVVRINPN